MNCIELHLMLVRKPRLGLFFCPENSNDGRDGSNYSCARAIERRALQSEAMILWFGVACKMRFWSDRL